MVIKLFLAGGRASNHTPEAMRWHYTSEGRGKLIVEYKDGDNNVYKHQTARKKEDVDKWRKKFNNTSGNGINITKSIWGGYYGVGTTVGAKFGHATYQSERGYSTTNSGNAEDAQESKNNKSGTPWMDAAIGQMGQSEMSPGNNPAIIAYHATTGGFKNDETAWCSSFANWCMIQADIKGTNNAMAFSWKTWGKGLDKPAYGAIAVMDYSHVGFVAGINKDGRFILLGGNQGKPGSVNLSPNSMGSVLRYRYPIGFVPNYNLPVYNLKGRSLNVSSTH